MHPKLIYLLGKRKPALEFYMEVLDLLGVEAASCIFVDDRFFHYLV